MEKTVLHSTFNDIPTEDAEDTASYEQLPELVNELKDILHKASMELISPRDRVIKNLLEQA